MNIPYFQFRFSGEQRESLDRAYERVMDSGIFINGDETRLFEGEVAEYLGVENVLACSSGYDAIYTGLKLFSERKLRVLLPSNAFNATLNAVLNAGHEPVFYDIDFTDNGLRNPDMDFLKNHEIDLILPVHYFGKVSKVMAELSEGYTVMEDFSQAFGSTLEGRKAGTIGDFAAASLYPTKNLAALGDAGILVCYDSEMKERGRKMINYGVAGNYNSEMAGVNSRIDELQAAFLRENLARIDEFIAEKRRIASFYLGNLGPIEQLELPDSDIANNTYHIFSVKTERRNELKSYLAKKGINTLIHYPIPIFDQKAFKNLDYSTMDRQNTAKWHNSVLSLPCFPGLKPEELEYITEAIKKFFLK